MSTDINLDEKVQRIRSAYPNPVSLALSNSCNDGYCVGGAVCMSVGMFTSRPTIDMIAVALSKINPSLSLGDSIDYALEIINYNDRREFASAWAVVNEAVTR